MFGVVADRKRNKKMGSLDSRLRIERLEAREMLTADAAAAAVNAFGLDVYEHLQHEEGNLLFSPLSLSSALAMTSLGAAGQTAAEMQQVLHLGSDLAIHDSYRDLMTSLLLRSITVDDYELLVSNAIWPDDELALLSDFEQAIQTDYFGHVETVDYGSPQQAEETINAWIAGRTDGKIDDLVKDLSPLTVMVLTNALLFESLWDIPFDDNSGPYPQIFHLSDQESVTTPIMYGQPDASRAQILGFDILELPFAEDQASMILIMPAERHGPNYLSTELLVGVEDWLETDPDRERLEVRMPRFETTIENNFNQLLKDLGMPTAFNPAEADFSEMFEGAAGVAIKKVAHEATIEVTEQGTKAAAATEVELWLCFAAGTPVLTPEGSKRIEELLVGDLVLSRDEHNLEAPVEAKRIEETLRGDSPILELTIHGRTVRTTDLHPFFVIGHGWTPAGKLKIGDRLMTDGDRPAVVEGVVQTEESVPVFNLRVADHHTYFVGEKDWGFAVWTHNFYGTGFYVDQPFHYLIRDNVTSTIAFMGRVDDPTQVSNTVTPTIQVAPATPGDFDADGDIDQADYDVWRAAYGQTGADLPADANGDGVVNTADYTVWRDNLEPAAASSPSAEPDTASEGPALAPVVQAQTTRDRSQGRPPLRAPIDLVIESDLLLLTADLQTFTVEDGYEEPALSRETGDSLDRGFAELAREYRPGARGVRGAFR